MSHLNLTFKGTQSIRILAKPNSHFGHYFKIISVMQKHCLGGFVWVDTHNIEINKETRGFKRQTLLQYMHVPVFSVQM